MNKSFRKGMNWYGYVFRWNEDGILKKAVI